MPGAAVGVLEDAAVGAEIAPLDRRPEEEYLRQDAHRRATRLRLADGADAPRPILRAVDAPRIDGDAPAGVRDRALPAAELSEARRVHDDAALAAHRLPRLLDARRARREGERALDAGLVRRERDAHPAHRLHDLEPERADLRLAALGGRAARGVEGVLLAAAHDAEPAVHDLPVRVHREAQAEVELAVVREAVEPVAVVDVPIGGRGMRDRLGRLMDRVVVESREHGRLNNHTRVRAAKSRRCANGNPGRCERPGFRWAPSATFHGAPCAAPPVTAGAVGVRWCLGPRRGNPVTRSGCPRRTPPHRSP